MSDVVKLKGRGVEAEFQAEVRAFALRKLAILKERGATRIELHALHSAVIADMGATLVQIQGSGALDSRLITRMSLDHMLLAALGAVAILSEDPGYGTDALIEQLEAAVDEAMKGLFSTAPPTKQ